MKKMRLIIVTIICLVTTLVVSSFAWFAIGNNGILSTDIETRNQLVIDFSLTGSNSEAMMPAKLKKGVINNPSGGIIGNSVSVPSGPDVLPKKDSSWKYVVENGSLVSNSEYLDTPATIVYSQFALTIESTSETGYKDLEFSFKVRYYNVDQIKDGELKTPIDRLPIFEQMNALAFNFYVIESTGGLTEEQLNKISTNKGTVETNETIEEFMISTDSVKFHSNDCVDHLNGLDLKDDMALIEKIIYSYYRYPAKAIELNEDKYFNVSITNIKLNQTYYVLLESYYNIPDAMVEGNLPLTGQFVLDLSYTHYEASNPPQE